MADSINDIAIRLSVDAAGVSRGFRTAAEEARAYQKEIERLSYAVGKDDPKQYNAHTEQYQRVMEDRIQREKLMQEDFHRWYAAELEQEFQTWYAMEQRKEAAARQSAINITNAQKFQAVPEAETLSRAKENDALEAAIRERYAMMDAANKLERAQRLDAKRAADDARRQELNDMRAFQAEQSRLEQESVRATQAAAERKAEATIRRIRSQQYTQFGRNADQHQADVTRRNNQDIADATRLLQRHMTVQERYAQSLAELTRLYHSYNIATGQALLTDQQFARIKANLTIATIRQQQAATAGGQAAQRMAGGFGGAAMAMGQASYAAEDFIQVLSMGGGLNMALMSASNNLSMMARALIGGNGAMSAFAGIAIPAALIGVGLFVRYLLSEEEQAKSTADALRDLAEAVDDVYKAKERALAQKFLMEDIRAMDSLNSIDQKRIEQERELTKMLLEQQKIEEKLLRLREEAAHLSGSGVPLNLLLNDVAEQISAANSESSQAEINALVATKTAELRLVYEALQKAIESGTEEEILRAGRQYEQLLSEYTFMGGAFSGEFVDAAHERISTLLEEEDAVKAITDAYREGADNAAAIADHEAAILELEQQRIKLMNEMSREGTVRQQQLREEMLFMLRATDAEKALLDLRKQQEQFLGPAAFGMMNMGGGPAAAMMQGFMDQQNAADRIAFLEAQRDAIKKEMQSTVPGFQGGTTQNPFDAQASAFEQVFKTMNKKPDAQLERQIKLLEGIEKALLNGGHLQVIP